MILRALHLNVFDQPVKNNFFNNRLVEMYNKFYKKERN